MKQLFKHPEFRAGASDMAAVAPGIAAWGLMMFTRGYRVYLGAIPANNPNFRSR